MSSNDSQDLLFIVTGSHLDAERYDRATAYRLLEHLEQQLGHGAAVVCSDLWLLNQPFIRVARVISIGSPRDNALSAYLADKLPSVLLVENRIAVQMDTSDDPVRACCWGADHSLTTRAAALFADQFLDAFLAAA